MVNPNLEGKTYPPGRPYLVGREKIREFAEAVMASSPLSLDVEAAREAGYADVVAPPTFAVVVAQREEYALLEDPEAAIDFQHLVHGDESFKYEQPIVAGDTITAQVTVKNVKSMRGLTMLGTSTTLTNQRDEAVAEVEAGFVIREVEGEA